MANQTKDKYHKKNHTNYLTRGKMYVTTSLLVLVLASDWLRGWGSFLDQSQSKVKQN